MRGLHSIFVRDGSRCHSPEPTDDGHDISPWPSLPSEDVPKCPPSTKDHQRPITGLPRQTTFRRQNSERRERLCPIEPLASEKRAASASRRASTSCVRRRRTKSSPPPINLCRASAPAAPSHAESLPSENVPVDLSEKPPTKEASPQRVYNDSVFEYEERQSRPLSRASSVPWLDDEMHRDQLQHELDTRWILNLSMHFRDRSDREKFFVTYAETPTKWRRVTVSCDYRSAERGSLEMDLKELQSQRDKSLAIYEAIRESLPEIQFYDTVTNLKLETSDGRLHVHVTEDLNEIIPYPSRAMVRHVLEDPDPDARPMELCEKDLAFDAHLSGFVYRVWHQDKVYIKKEIPGPDTIDEFLYEINALHALHGSENIIKLKAIILDDAKQVVKGLLINYAEQGAVVDILYDHKGDIPWHRRERWARQAVEGLRDIHEEGYVQGDFTLSNIVVDENNDAKIIDINRRGCPVGWEPPEIAQKIASNQRISMYIGEKSDIYQLGMTLWALAMDDDEPERHDPPLSTNEFPAYVPEWFRHIVDICLSRNPRDRLSAKELARLFPKVPEHDACESDPIQIPPRPHPILRPEPKQYIDPDAAVERDDLERFKKEEELLYSPQSSKDEWMTFTYPKSSEYDIDSSTSAFDGQRGRKPACRTGQNSLDERLNQSLNAQIVEIAPDDNLEADEIRMDGNHFLVPAGTFNSNELCILDDNSPPPGCPTTMTLTPTQIDKSPSPFRLPNWRRSLSESTPRNSRVQLLSDCGTDSPDISPRSTLLALPERPRSAGAIKYAKSSNDTISAGDISVGETSLSGTTCFTHSFAVDELRHQDSDKLISDTVRPPDVKVGLVASPSEMPPIAVHDSGYDDPSIHEMTKQ